MSNKKNCCCGQGRICPSHGRMTLEENVSLVILDQLVSELKAQCNRHVNGCCMTLSCLKRGGYKGGDKPDYSVATCERFEQIMAIETLLANTVV